MSYFRTISIWMFSFFLLFNAFENVYAEEVELDIQSESVVLMDMKSGQIIYGKNEQQQMYPASITKIATAIYAIENSDLDEIVTISENARNVDGTRVYLEEGEKVPLEKLLVGLMVNSGNDAAVAIAEHIDGTVGTFSKHMNQYLKEKIGTNATHFMNPHGLFDPNHYTTAEDMAKITQYAMKNETFQKIFQTVTYEWDGETWDTTLLTHHRLLKGEFPYEGITGGKNGYVGESGHTLVTTAKNKNIELVAVTLKAIDNDIPYMDTIQLLDYGLDNYETIVVQKGSTLNQGADKFIVPNDLYFTIRSNANYEQKVNDEGILSILDSDGALLAEYPLEPVISAITTPHNSSVKKDNVSSNSASFFSKELFSYFWIVAVTVGISILLLRRFVLKKQF